jgi:hypothetical protein
MRRGRAPGTLVALLLALAGGTASAQAPYDACVDRRGTPIPSRTDNRMSYAGMATMEDGKPVIRWNRKLMDGAPEVEQAFIYFHECAHHNLGHLAFGDAPRMEVEADCWAIQLLVDGGLFAHNLVDTLLERRATVQADMAHLGGDAHAWSLQRCLSLRTDREEWARALPPLLEAARDGFQGIRGAQLDGPAAGAPGVWASRLDLPGTYDCEVVGSQRLRCIIFVSRKQGPAESRYRKMIDVLGEVLPPEWPRAENASKVPSLLRAFHARDPASATIVSLLLGRDAKVQFVVTPPAPAGD